MIFVVCQNTKAGTCSPTCCRMHNLLVSLLLVFLLLCAAPPSRAQTATGRASLFALDTSAYPTISAALDVFDANGNFITDLTPEQVTLLEDGQPISPERLDLLQPGVRFAVALDPGQAFAFRGSDAISRLDKVKTALQAWAAVHPDALGDLISLIPTGGVANTNDSAAAFAEALSAYQPDLLTVTPTLDTLSRALDAVSEAGPQAGMKRVVLYIASPPDAASVPALQNLTQRAVDLDVRVHVWIVTSEDFFFTSGATALKDLAIRTGGQYTLFSGSETLPDLETVLAPLRYTYTLTYASAIRAPGAHSLTVQAAVNGETLASNTLTFDLNVLPPNPILVSPPEQIVRQGPDPRATDFSLFRPDVQAIEAIIEFPDGYLRPLSRTLLYVDGKVVDENSAAPFDQFSWDLSAYTTSGEHILQVEAVDSLGLSNVSLGIKVNVTVVRPERGLLPFLARNSLWVVLAGVGLAGVTLAVTLLFGHKRKGAAERKPKDALSQPAELLPEKQSSLLRWRRSAVTRQSAAYLLRLKEDGQPITAPPIPVATPETTFGSDPIQATRVLDDPSVSPLHARLREEHGHFVLTDEKSAAGTWVNYEMLTAPRILQHGDILHIGRISYRFMLRKPPQSPLPSVQPLKK